MIDLKPIIASYNYRIYGYRSGHVLLTILALVSGCCSLRRYMVKTGRYTSIADARVLIESKKELLGEHYYREKEEDEN